MKKDFENSITRRDFFKKTTLAGLGGLAMTTDPILNLLGSVATNKGQLENITISGRYPHLAMFNHNGECGIGAVVPWAGRLWVVTYAPHKPYGSDDGLYEITPDLQINKRPESIGGTPANRMIHRESNQLFIGPYAIDDQRKVRPIPYKIMSGRPTANARHLLNPEGKIYYMTMEEGMYEVDVNTLEVTTLYQDQNGPSNSSAAEETPGYTGYQSIGGERLPGYHGKGGYTGQGHVVYANNGRIGGGNMTDYTLPSGCLASWEGGGEEWQVIENRQFTEITGPGGIRGNKKTDDPLWSLGWDYRSLILKLFDDGEWNTFRLPKSDYSYEGLHGWHTEWPRIRQVGPKGQYLMNHHGMWFEFPANFSRNDHPAPIPIASHLKITGDFARWNDQIVFGCDDAALNTFGLRKSLVGQSQSNLWFTTWEKLKSNGSPYGFGGPWLQDDVAGNTPSDPYSFQGFTNRQLHISHENAFDIAFTIEVDRKGTGKWQELTTIIVPAFGYLYHKFDDDLSAEWIRLTANRSGKYVTASFHYGIGGGTEHDIDMFRMLAPSDTNTPKNMGLIYPKGKDKGTLGFVAWNINKNGDAKEAGYYEMDEDLILRRVKDNKAHENLKEKAEIGNTEFLVDDASVIIKDQNGRPYRLPKGSSNFDSMTNFGHSRSLREVVTERDLLNAFGIFYCLPRPNSGGIANIKPITTHNKRISDFCSWRGLLVLAGCQDITNNDSKHFFKSDDDKVGLWLGDIDDLWKLGKPTGVGGPWKNTQVYPGHPSDPYLMTGFDKKYLELSHDHYEEVEFIIEICSTMNVKVKGDGYSRWNKYKSILVKSGEKKKFEFPKGFSAHWCRFKADKKCRSSALLFYT